MYGPQMWNIRALLDMVEPPTDPREPSPQPEIPAQARFKASAYVAAVIVTLVIASALVFLVRM